MAAKDADLARDYSLDFVYISNGPGTVLEVSLLTTPQQSLAGANPTGDRTEELFIVPDLGTVLEIELIATPHGSALGGPVYRMRAYDTDLARVVYWNAVNIDLADTEYTGNPLALTNIVVSVAIC
jgi:hypothetical protein